MNYHPVLAENQTNSNVGFQDLEKVREEGTQTYVLFPILSDGSINPKNNKDAHTGTSSNGVSADGPLVFAAGLDFTNSTNDFTAVGPLVSAAELNFTNSTNDFSAAGPSNAAMPNLEDLSHNADDDPSWIKAMQEKLLQFKMQKVWILVDLPYGKREIGTKWVYRNKKDERGIVVRNKARLVAQGHTQEEGIEYEEGGCDELELSAALLSKFLLSGKCVVCLPNEEIFAGLAQMGYEKPSNKLIFYKAFFSIQWKFLIHTILQSLSAKRTLWNEFSTEMASAVICLSKGQRFNFSRVGKGFSGVETPLFENMLEVREVDAEEEVQVPAQDDVDQENVTEEIVDDVAQPASPLPPSPVIPSLPPHQSPRPPPPQADEENVFNQGRISVDIDEGIELIDDQEKDSQVKGRQADTQAEIYNIDLDHTSKVLSMQEDTKVQEVVNAAKLMTEVVTAAATQVVVASTPILAAKPAVVAVVAPISAAKPAAKPKVLKSAKDKGKGLLVEDPKPMKKKDQIEMDAEYARKLQEEEESHVQAKDVQAKDSKEEMEKEQEEIIKSINEIPAQKAVKRRRLRKQAKEDENLKKQLEVVVDEDDDVLIEATPIGIKVPVVNYEIVMINNKPRYKIFRADNTHQLYNSFITLLKNFDRQDLEDLWKIVKARFSTSKPTNFFDDYLLATLKNIFEKTDAQDLLELMLLKRSKENTKCVSAAGEELIAVKHKLILLELKLFKDAAAAAHMK
nr:ribonuclease H-like domain-containing protein [Tanacetum cinerariifolium]